MRCRTRTAAAALLTVCLLVGCTRRACSDIGATSGVTFDLSQILANRAGHVHVRACVEGSCVTRLASADRWNYVPVNVPSITGPRSVSVQLTVTDFGGRSIFDSTGDVRLHMFQPNGPDCPPTAYAAAVAATPEGQLEQLPRP